MIAIKDMEMPECCYDCILHDLYPWGMYCHVTSSEVKNVNQRLNDCPLVDTREN